MSKYDLILRLCQEKGVKITNVEEELGFARGSFKKIDSSKPSAEKIYALASFFGVPMELFYDDNAYERMEQYVERFKENYKKNRQEVYDVACGNGRINGDYSSEYMDEETEEGFSWCEVHGDSMSPILLDGDFVKVEHMTQTERTDLTVVKVDGESATIKYVEVVENGIWLRAENKEVFSDCFYSVQDVLTLPITIVGKVVELKRKF